MMASHSSIPLSDIWQYQMHDSTACWQAFFKIQTQNMDALTQWQSCIGQSCTAWLNVWQQWQDALGQWLTSWSDISGYALKSTPPFGMLFPPLDDLSRLHQALIQLMAQSTDIMRTGLGALAPGWAVELTTQVADLETAMTGINQHLETIAARLDTSDTVVTEQIQALRDQVQTTHAATAQQLRALTQRP
jgi:hypothetical protein